MRTWWALMTAIIVVVLLATGCGSDDESGASETGDGTADTTAGADDDTETDDGTDDSGGSDDATGDDGGTGGDFGSIVFGDQTIALTSSLCFLEEQDAAAGGGKILFVAQGSGTDAAGEPVALDVSRFDEDSQFSGDKSNIVIGDPFSDSAASWDANGDIGTVSVEGSTVSADGLTWVNTDDRSEQPGSFSVNC